MDRASYNACIGKAIRGKKLTKEERKLEFCIVSKLCSGKTSSRDEAQRICSLPKPPKTAKTRRSKKGGQSCEKEVLALSHCVAENIDMNLASNINSVEMAVANALMVCQCPSQT